MQHRSLRAQSSRSLRVRRSSGFKKLALEVAQNLAADLYSFHCNVSKAADMSKESKFLSLVLRHKPEEIGLRLDAQGWADVDDLLRRIKKAGRRLSFEELVSVVETNDKSLDAG